MRAKLFSRGTRDPLCDAELEIRGQAAHGAPFEARLKEADAHIAVELEDGVMFLADDGQRYEGSVQHAFHTPQHGVLLQGALETPPENNVESPEPADRHAGYRLFVSPTGRAGFALGTHARRTGWLYDFFAAPGEEADAANLMGLAVHNGARQLITYDHPFLVDFFSQFGFRTRVKARPDQLKDPPGEWIPTARSSLASPIDPPDFLLMVRVPDATPKVTRAAPDTQSSPPVPGTHYSQKGVCTACGGNIREQTSMAGRPRWIPVPELPTRARRGNARVGFLGRFVSPQVRIHSLDWLASPAERGRSDFHVGSRLHDAQLNEAWNAAAQAFRNRRQECPASRADPSAFRRTGPCQRKGRESHTDGKFPIFS